jgi:hypothetical protein
MDTKLPTESTHNIEEKEHKKQLGFAIFHRNVPEIQTHWKSLLPSLWQLEAEERLEFSSFSWVLLFIGSQ